VLSGSYDTTVRVWEIAVGDKQRVAAEPRQDKKLERLAAPSRPDKKLQRLATPPRHQKKLR